MQYIKNEALRNYFHQYVLTQACALYDRKLAMSLMLWTMVQACSPKAPRRLLVLLPVGLVQTQRNWKGCQKMHWNWLSRKLSLTLSETSMSSLGSKAWFHRYLVPWRHPSLYHHLKPHLSNLSETLELCIARIAISDVVDLAFYPTAWPGNGTSGEPLSSAVGTGIPQLFSSCPLMVVMGGLVWLTGCCLDCWLHVNSVKTIHSYHVSPPHHQWGIGGGGL